MQTAKTCLLLLIISMCLGACGLKGPLYLPDESTPNQADTGKEAAPEETEDKKTDEKKDSPTR